MKKSILFYHPRDVGCKKAERLLHKNNYAFDLQDVTINGISSYLYEDMRIEKLPALFVISENNCRIYEGLDKIVDLLREKLAIRCLD